MNDGAPGFLVATERQERPDGVRVYNFSVADSHTYFVAPTNGGQAMLVHNAEGPLGCKEAIAKVTTPWQRQVRQRVDIDWDFVRPEGIELSGPADRAAAALGYAPVRVNSATGRIDDVVLLRVLDDPRGVVVETWRSNHTRYHNLMKRDPACWRELRPDWAQAWSREQSAYWRWRMGAHNPAPAAKLRLPADPS